MLAPCGVFSTYKMQRALGVDVQNVDIQIEERRNPQDELLDLGGPVQIELPKQVHTLQKLRAKQPRQRTEGSENHTIDTVETQRKAEQGKLPVTHVDRRH